MEGALDLGSRFRPLIKAALEIMPNLKGSLFRLALYLGAQSSEPGNKRLVASLVGFNMSVPVDSIGVPEG